MKRFFTAAAIATAALGAVDASAQASDSNWVNVNARVVGIFDFQIDGDDWTDAATDAATYNFGDVSVDGTTTGTATAAVGATSTTFTQTAAFGWEVSSAPRRDVTIAYQNAQLNPAATLTLDDLEIQMTGTGTSAGYVDLNQGDNTQVYSETNVGNGNNSATGNIDLRLTIDDTNAEGSNSFTFELVATGV